MGYLFLFHLDMGLNAEMKFSLIQEASQIFAKVLPYF